MKRYLIALLAGGILCLSGSSMVQADSTAIDESWPMPNETAPGFFGAIFMDTGSSDHPSYLLDNSKLQNPNQNPTCSSVHASDCNLGSYRFEAVIPTCKSQSDINCISEMGVINSAGKKIPGQYQRNYPNKAENEYVGDPKLRIPSGTSGSIFTIPGVAHNQGDQFFVRVLLKGGGSGGNSAATTDFEASVYPVSLVPANTQTCGQPTTCPNTGWANADPHSNGRWGIQGVGEDGIHNCVAYSTGEQTCAQRSTFPDNLSFYLKLKFNVNLTGWLHGRLTDPNISISKSGEITTFDLSGKPVAVPVVYGGGQYSDLPQSIKDAYDPASGSFKEGTQGSSFGRLCCTWESDPNRRNLMSLPSPSGFQGIDELKTWLPFVHDKAVATMTTWEVRTLGANEISGSNSCFSDPTKVTGIVTTNSSEYSAGPPTFDQESGTLNYQVASAHYLPNGDVFKGKYDLLMASSVARCVYGFSSAPINATISVTSADGTPEIATTVVGEKNGWLHLQAANFDFSSPTVKAKLTQDASAPAAATSPKSTGAKPTTITCVKGKVSKVVTSRACPTGFKRK